MSTRGNVIFLNNWYIEDENVGEEYFSNLSMNSEILKRSHHIYVHSDMYPSGAIADLQEFLRMDGAKHRATDTSYLSAWFVGWKCLDMSKWTRRFGDRDFKVENCKNPSLKNFKESKDFFGIGLQREPSDWVSFSYAIAPVVSIVDDKYSYDKNSFDIYIYDGCLEKFLGKVNSETNIDKCIKADWWY